MGKHVWKSLKSCFILFKIMVENAEKKVKKSKTVNGKAPEIKSEEDSAIEMSPAEDGIKVKKSKKNKKNKKEKSEGTEEKPNETSEIVSEPTENGIKSKKQKKNKKVEKSEKSENSDEKLNEI